MYLEETDDTVLLKGSNNLTQDDTRGVRVLASLDLAYRAEYAAFLGDRGDTGLLPVEYYKVEWLAFNGNAITRRSIPVGVSHIDASKIRLQSGADFYLQQILGDSLTPWARPTTIGSPTEACVAPAPTTCTSPRPSSCWRSSRRATGPGTSSASTPRTTSASC